MNVPHPHFLLYSDSHQLERQDHWKFVLQAADGSTTLEAEDWEEETRGERLELLAVVRGLEALDQPSRVTLVTGSRYVQRGLTFGLDEWRRNEWTWESFGEMVPIKHRDLWQRLDRALGFHRLDMRVCRIDEAHTSPAQNASPTRLSPPASHQPLGSGPHFRRTPQDIYSASVRTRTRISTRRRHVRWARFRRRAGQWLSGRTLDLARWGIWLLPLPWLG